MLSKLAQTGPFRRVHVYVLFIADVFLVELVEIDFLLTMTRPQQLQEVALELSGEIVDCFSRIFANSLHVSDVGLGGDMALEAVLIAHLALASLAPPSQPLKAFRLHLIRDVLG